MFILDYFYFHHIGPTDVFIQLTVSFIVYLMLHCGLYILYISVKFIEKNTEV